MRTVLYTCVGALAGILGGYSMANPSAGLVLFYWTSFGVLIVTLVILEFRRYLKSQESAKRERDRQVAGCAKEWAQARIQKGTRRRLEEFWNSAIGQHMQNNPYVYVESARIVRIGQDDPVPTLACRFTHQLNEREVLHIEIHPRFLVNQNPRA